MNNYNNIHKYRERILKNFYPVYHAPLIFDVSTQTFYRKTGYVAWPGKQNAGLNQNKEEEKKLKNKQGNNVYFAYPEDNG